MKKWAYKIAVLPWLIVALLCIGVAGLACVVLAYLWELTEQFDDCLTDFVKS